MFYNTGIATYVWVLTNRKPPQRKGKVQLVDATAWFTPLRRNLGKKNCELSPTDIDRVVRTFLDFDEAEAAEQSKVFDNADFGYYKVQVERPLRLAGTEPGRVYKAAEIKALKETAERDETAPPIIKKLHQLRTPADPLLGRFEAEIDGKTRVIEYEPDSELRDHEQIPLIEDAGEWRDGIESFIRREVLPYARAKRKVVLAGHELF